MHFLHAVSEHAAVPCLCRGSSSDTDERKEDTGGSPQCEQVTGGECISSVLLCLSPAAHTTAGAPPAVPGPALTRSPVRLRQEGECAAAELAPSEPG